MVLSDDEVKAAVSEASNAFANFSEWQTNNTKNDYYDGFAVWGRLRYYSDVTDGSNISFFVTFSREVAGWTGNLTIGHPLFYWASTDVGDAILVSTGPEGALSEAIRVLKERVRMLFAMLDGTP
jgi:hypothetical protein